MTVEDGAVRSCGRDGTIGEALGLEAEGHEDVAELVGGGSLEEFGCEIDGEAGTAVMELGHQGIVV